MTFKQWLSQKYPPDGKTDLERILAEAWFASARECALACKETGAPYRSSSLKVAMATDACMRACEYIARTGT